MSEKTDAVREHLVRALDWEEAHAGFDSAVKDLPGTKRGLRPQGFDHSPWELLEHLRIAQEDILEFCVDPDYTQSLAWPEGYWPKQPAPPTDRSWDESVKGFRESREALKKLVRDTADLAATVPTGKGKQTYLRAVLLAIDHAAYHVGQLVAVRRALGAWQ